MSWTNVNEKLPHFDQYVLWYREDGKVFQECIDKDSCFDDLNRDKTWGEITHWREPDSPHDRKPYYIKYSSYQMFGLGMASGLVLALLLFTYFLS